MSKIPAVIGKLLFFHRELGSDDEDATFEERSERLLFFYKSSHSTSALGANSNYAVDANSQRKESATVDFLGEEELAVLHMLESLIEFSAKFCSEKVDSFLTRREFWTIYECEKNIFICASVSLFDSNDHKERKISRRKIGLYVKEIYKNFVIENGRMSSILGGDRAVSSFVSKAYSNDHKKGNEEESEKEKEKKEKEVEMQNKYNNTYALMTGWELIDYVKKLRTVLKKLLLQQSTLVWDIKNRSNNINQNSCISENERRSANGQSMTSPSQTDIDPTDNCKNSRHHNNGLNCTNINYGNNTDVSYDDDTDSDSCCTSHVTNNNNNAFDGVDNGGTHTSKHYIDQFALLNLQKEIEETKKSLCQILNNDDSVLDMSYDSIKNNETVHNIHIDQLEARTTVPDRCTYTVFFLKKKLRQFLYQHETQNEIKNEIPVNNEHLIRPVNKMITNTITGDDNDDIDKNEKYSKMSKNGRYHEGNEICFINYTYIENLYSFDNSYEKKVSRDYCTDDNYGNKSDNVNNNDDNNDNNDIDNDFNDDNNDHNNHSNNINDNINDSNNDVDNNNDNNDFNNGSDDNTLFRRQIFRFENSRDVIGTQDVKKKSSSASSWDGGSSSLQKILHYFK